MHFKNAYPLILFGLTIIPTTVFQACCAQQPTEPLVANSPDGQHSGSKLAEAITAATIESVKNNPNYTDAQKARMLKALEGLPDATEVADAIKEGKFEIDANDKKWGMIWLHGRFSTTERTGCWTDITTAQMHIELFTKIPNQRGLVVGRRDRSVPNQVLTHITGARCRDSDQGPMITDDASCEIRVLGYRDVAAKGYNLSIEGTDKTRWTLKSGGDIGIASFLNFYLPHMMADTGTGGLGGLFVSDEQIEKHQPIVFKGKVTGTGSTTIGAVSLQFYPAGETNTIERDMEIQRSTHESLMSEFNDLLEKAKATGMKATAK